jgi:hypothetical protein
MSLKWKHRSLKQVPRHGQFLTYTLLHFSSSLAAQHSFKHVSLETYSPIVSSRQLVTGPPFCPISTKSDMSVYRHPHEPGRKWMWNVFTRVGQLGQCGEKIQDFWSHRQAKSIVFFWSLVCVGIMNSTWRLTVQDPRRLLEDIYKN